MWPFFRRAVWRLVDRPMSTRNRTAETRGQSAPVESVPLVSAREQRSRQLSLWTQGEEYDPDNHCFLRWSMARCTEGCEKRARDSDRTQAQAGRKTAKPACTPDGGEHEEFGWLPPHVCNEGPDTRVKGVYGACARYANWVCSVVCTADSRVWVQATRGLTRWPAGRCTSRAYLASIMVSFLQEVLLASASMRAGVLIYITHPAAGGRTHPTEHLQNL